MTDANDYERFAAHVRLVDTLVEQLPKDDVAEAARILALQVAQYEAKYGPLPLEASQAFLTMETLDEPTAKLLADAMQALAGVLGLVAQGDEDTRPH